MNEIAKKVKSVFIEKFGGSPSLFFSPGRINLIGEHIDYNDGYVMPAAIDMGIYFAIAANHTDTIRCFSHDFNEMLSVPLDKIKKSDGWKNYVLGVADQFVKAKKKIKGFDCVFAGDIPAGAGLSSSAALEGISFAINKLFHFKMDRRELALLGQRAEHAFPGVMCGIMDQYANLMGKKDKVMLLDCKKISNEYFPLEARGYELVLINSRVHHSLAASEYNVRRNECEAGLRILKKGMRIRSFRDIKNPVKIFPYKSEMGNRVFKRCLFVVEEIQRTRKAALLLQKKDLKGFGKLMFEAHDGLQNLYEVSCREIDFLVEQAKNHPAVIGARIMGGGFGGCTINLVRQGKVADFLREILPAYKKQFKIDAESYAVKIADGVDEIKEDS